MARNISDQRGGSVDWGRRSERELDRKLSLAAERAAAIVGARVNKVVEAKLLSSGSRGDGGSRQP